jgi:hypothetical protein
MLLGAVPVMAQTPAADQLPVLMNLPVDQPLQLLQGAASGNDDYLQSGGRVASRSHRLARSNV